MVAFEIAAMLTCIAFTIQQSDYTHQYLDDVNSALAPYHSGLCPPVVLSQDLGDARIQLSSHISCLSNAVILNPEDLATLSDIVEDVEPYRPDHCAAVNGFDNPADHTPIILFLLGSRNGELGGTGVTETILDGECAANSEAVAVGCTSAKALISWDSFNDMNDIPTKMDFNTLTNPIVSKGNITIASSFVNFIGGNLLTSLQDAAVISSGGDWWTASQTAGVISSSSCEGWSSSSNGPDGRIGRSTSITSTAIDAVSENCNQLNSIVCICAGGTPFEYEV